MFIIQVGFGEILNSGFLSQKRGFRVVFGESKVHFR